MLPTARRILSTGRNRATSLPAAAATALTRAATQQLTKAGLGAMRGVAGPIAATLVSQIVGEIGRVRRGGGSIAGLQSLAIQGFGGVGRAIAWLAGGRRGAPQATPSEVATARQIVNRVRDDIPMPMPARVDPSDPATEPLPGSGGRGGRGGRGGDTGRIGGGRIGGTGRGEPPNDAGGDETGGGGGGQPRRNGIQWIRVTNSSNVHSYAYEPETATLYVRYLGMHLDKSKVTFKKNDRQPGNIGGFQHIHVGKGAMTGRSAKPGPAYAYDGVPSYVFRRMRAAASKGVFIWDELRVRGSIYKHKYPYRLVGVGVANIGLQPDGRPDTIMYVPRRATKAGYRARKITVASGQTVLSNMSRTTSRRGAIRNR